MEKISIAKVRSAYCKQVEKDHRSLSEYLRLINADFEAYAAGKPAATERARESYDFFNASAMKKENISLSFIKQWYKGIDTKSRICDFKLVPLSEESEARAKFTDYDFILDEKGICRMLVPVNLWTCSKTLSKIAAAIKAKKESESAASAAEREQQKAERERKQYESALARVKAYESKQAQPAQQQQSESKSESKSKQAKQQSKSSK